LKLAISSDDINNRHKAGLRKIFRRKRDTRDEEVTESKLGLALPAPANLTYIIISQIH
jgi:hypothetical protein